MCILYEGISKKLTIFINFLFFSFDIVTFDACLNNLAEYWKNPSLSENHIILSSNIKKIALFLSNSKPVKGFYQTFDQKTIISTFYKNLNPNHVQQTS